MGMGLRVCGPNNGYILQISIFGILIQQLEQHVLLCLLKKKSKHLRAVMSCQCVHTYNTASVRICITLPVCAYV